MLTIGTELTNAKGRKFVVASTRPVGPLAAEKLGQVAMHVVEGPWSAIEWVIEMKDGKIHWMGKI